MERGVMFGHGFRLMASTLPDFCIRHSAAPQVSIIEAPPTMADKVPVFPFGRVDTDSFQGLI